MTKVHCNRCSVGLRDWELCGRGFCEACEGIMNWDYLPGEVAESCEWTVSGWVFRPQNQEPVLFSDEAGMIAEACKYFGYSGIEDAINSMRRL
jgi:hypothetical protein